ncbi:MAG TPA: hypothetical protein VHD39_04510 [Acidimicrobiales bacterium]|nr:hypothetical protein [Acidimicrobiales bacterium]
MLTAGCTGLDALNPVCQVGSLGGSIAASGFESVLSGISQWVASGAEWLLGQIGDVLVATTTIDVGASWFRTHYGQMTALAGVVILPLLLLSTLQAILRQNPGQLLRTFLLQLPLALLLGAVAIQVVIMSLSVTDEMSDAIAGGTGGDVSHLLSGVTTGLVEASADPTIASFVLLLISLLIAVAAFVLWLELLIRAAAVYVAVLFLPLALVTLVWPAVSHWTRRLVETLAALILSKFFIVATLSLAAGAISSGTAGTGSHGAGFSAVLAGGALLLMATFVPFAILRMIPAIEAGAVSHLDGLRARGTSAMRSLPRSAASHVLNEGLGAIGDARLLASVGAGAVGRASANGDGDEESSPGKIGDIPLDDGDPDTQRKLESAMARNVQSPPKGPKPIVGWTPEGDGDGGAGGGASGGGAVGSAAEAVASGAASADEELDPIEALRRERGVASLGPNTEAWMWEGVPYGRSLMGRVEAGQPRFYAGEDKSGLVLCGLSRAWPPGEGPNATSSGAGGVGGPGGVGKNDGAGGSPA